MSLDCGESAPFHKLFPHPHALKLTITVTNNAVRWDYAVDNSAGTTHVPFGFALHPWFLYQGERKETLLTVPATHWMEAVNLLPTGKLIALEETKLDARKGRSLEGFVIDDVYFGLRPDAPTRIEFRDKGLAIDLAASADFTHLVVYTPEGQPWFCVENQTCSTDAHNLHENGLKRESNLLIVEPGKSHSGWIEYRITESK
jgi:aldose 1-epimerase